MRGERGVDEHRGLEHIDGGGDTDTGGRVGRSRLLKPGEDVAIRGVGLRDGGRGHQGVGVGLRCRGGTSPASTDCVNNVGVAAVRTVSTCPARPRGARAAVRAPPGDGHEEEVADAIDGQYRALVILGAWCSLRFGELAGLRRSRVDLLHRKIHVTEQLVELAGGKTVFKSPKTDSGRTVDVPAGLVPIPEDHLAEYVGTEADALVFTSPEGHPLRRTKFAPVGPTPAARPG